MALLLRLQLYFQRFFFMGRQAKDWAGYGGRGGGTLTVLIARQGKHSGEPRRAVSSISSVVALLFFSIQELI